MKLIIDSQDRVSGTSSSFRVNILNAVSVKNKIKLVSAAILNSFYNITTANNMIYWQRSSTNYSGGIAPSNYFSSNISTAIAALMNLVDVGRSYSVVISSTSFMMTITANSSYILSFAGAANSIASIIGYLPVTTSTRVIMRLISIRSTTITSELINSMFLINQLITRIISHLSCHCHQMAATSLITYRLICHSHFVCPARL